MTSISELTSRLQLNKKIDDVDMKFENLKLMAQQKLQTQNLYQAPSQLKSAVLSSRSGDFQTQLLKSGLTAQNNKIGRDARAEFSKQIKEQFKKASAAKVELDGVNSLKMPALKNFVQQEAQARNIQPN